MTFGEFFEQLRAKRKMTLREFCEKNDFDPGNISKLERGILKAPQSHEKLCEYAQVLGIKKGSADWTNFFDLAVASHKNLEIKNVRDEAALAKLPVLFRALDRADLQEADLERLIEFLQKS